MFGGNGGLTVVDPGRVQPWTYPAPVVVTELDVGSGRVPVDRVRRTIELDPQRRHLQAEFAALDYSAPETLRYAYRLVGFDRDWVETDPTRRLASYTNLPPGDYALELRGTNRQGRWSPPVQWDVRVLPAWYETGWFRGALGLALLLSVVGLVQGRTMVLRRRQLALEELVARRTAELEQRSAELRESERRLEQMAYYDGLTGLPNRRLFADDMKRLLALAQRGEAFTLLLIDLDRFKEINDTLGHDAGDALLVAVARRLVQSVREIDRVARLGGDEFAVLLARSGERQPVEAVCERIANAVREPVEHRGGALRTTASIGIAACHGDCDADELYKAADVALYEVKRGGRDGWRWATAHTARP
jgi:diguanylate cyclase (GGDEF)-like protein